MVFLDRLEPGQAWLTMVPGAFPGQDVRQGLLEGAADQAGCDGGVGAARGEAFPTCRAQPKGERPRP
jgi:hypothetical protein